VAIKNVLPKEESDIENGADKYSIDWNIENNTPKKMVTHIRVIDLSYLFLSIRWWAQVTETPEEINKMVLVNGILIGLNVLIDVGGQYWPIKIDGDRLL
jgi:hypothetical protein